jgi:hypothetical protein
MVSKIATLAVRVADLEKQLEEAQSFRGRAHLIAAFEDEIASFQFAISVMKEFDKDYHMDSSKHIAVLEEYVSAALEYRKSKTVVL